MFKAFIKEPLKTCYDGEDQDEKILYVIRASILTLFPWILRVIVLTLIPLLVAPFALTLKFKGELIVNPSFTVLFSIFWYLVTFGVFLQGLASWFFNVYIITSKKILDMDFYGLTYKNISETTLENIQDVTSTISGTLRTVFNVGSVFIQTAAEKQEFEFTDIDNPSKIRDIVSDLIVHGGNHGIK